ncbi:hypothetical protein [Janthinobacterium sp. B9-8]|nr:hypothetical protein [Janthinobacterium sp. B9-8]
MNHIVNHRVACLGRCTLYGYQRAKNNPSGLPSCGDRVWLLTVDVIE